MTINELSAPSRRHPVTYAEELVNLKPQPGRTYPRKVHPDNAIGAMFSLLSIGDTEGFSVLNIGWETRPDVHKGFMDRIQEYVADNLGIMTRPLFVGAVEALDAYPEYQREVRVGIVIGLSRLTENYVSADPHIAIAAENAVSYLLAHKQNLLTDEQFSSTTTPLLLDSLRLFAKSTVQFRSHPAYAYNLLEQTARLEQPQCRQSILLGAKNGLDQLQALSDHEAQYRIIEANQFINALQVAPQPRKVAAAPA